jgi:acyl-CoA synthetase (AMP-forming)/AMP-acid ligase II/acyl carrier protein
MLESSQRLTIGDAWKTIPALLASQADTRGDSVALAAADGPSLTYADLKKTIDSLVASLREYGICRSSRLAVVLPNGVHVAVGLLAASSAGICVPLASQATADEYRVWLHTGRITQMLTSTEASPVAREVAKKMGLPVLMLTHGTAGYCVGSTNSTRDHVAASSPAGSADVAVVLMTSGSTGTPKRVPLTHGNLMAGTMSVARSLELDSSDCVLVMWEQYHVGGVVDLLLAPLAGGGSAVFAGGFDAARFFQLLDRVKPTWFQGVPATLRELLVHARMAGSLPVVSRLRLLRSVAAPLTPELMRELEAAFGIPVIQTFGMTEAAPLITTNRLPPGMRKPGSTGSACDCEVTVLDAAGEPLPHGATGEVAVRGPNVFAGYEDDPETNSRVFRHGWFMTGDIGRFDTDGFLFLTGRVKEMINRGGEKIAPAEIEEIATLHPAVSQAAAFAVPHPTLGEDVGLAVVPSGTVTIDREAVRSHVALHLSRFKVPAVVLVLDKLPRSPIGRVRRRALVELATNAQGSAQLVASSQAEINEDSLVTNLCVLWAFHLDLPIVGPDDEFEMVGGDSLSRIRLALAVESVCGVTLPEDAAAKITTVRRMAAEVRRLGGRVPLVTRDFPIDRTDASVDIWGDGGALVFADAAPADIRRKLAGSSTIREFEVARENLLDSLTIDELATVVRPGLSGPLAAWAGRLASASPWWVRGSERLRLAAELSAWRHEILTRAATRRGPPWQRERFAASAMLYRRQANTSERRRLVVGFAGNHQRLMLPTHLILDHLPPQDDLLLVTDPDRRHFAAGARGIAGSIQGVCDWIACQLAECGYESTITFGTSGGGLAAICAAYALGLHRAAAVAADSPGNHAELQRFLLGRIAAHHGGSHPTVILAYDSANHRDRAGGTSISALIPTSQTLIPSASGAHNTILPAFNAGRLTTFLHDLLVTDPSRLAVVDQSGSTHLLTSSTPR